MRPADNIGRFGNAGVGILVGPGTRVFSMTLGKAFATGGASRLRVEMAFSNLFNIENLDMPDTLNVTVERIRPRSPARRPWIRRDRARCSREHQEADGRREGQRVLRSDAVEL